MPPVQRRVLKIGGSLLTCQDLPTRLDAWVDQQPSAETIAIVGGGELVDAMRHLDAINAMDPEWLHWRCVDLLRVTFDWFAGRVPHWRIVGSKEEFASAFDARPDVELQAERRCLVAVQCFYERNHGNRDTEANVPKLPISWATTTDAIAALLSIRLNADELVLFKSCSVDTSRTLAELASDGIVDEAFPMFSDQVPPIRFVNLRD